MLSAWPALARYVSLPALAVRYVPGQLHTGHRPSCPAYMFYTALRASRTPPCMRLPTLGCTHAHAEKHGGPREVLKFFYCPAMLPAMPALARYMSLPAPAVCLPSCALDRALEMRCVCFTGRQTMLFSSWLSSTMSAILPLSIALVLIAIAGLHLHIVQLYSQLITGIACNLGLYPFCTVCTCAHKSCFTFTSTAMYHVSVLLEKHCIS